MLDRLKKLIDVKSLVTLALTGTFIYTTVNDHTSTDFLTIYTVIIGFYFGTQFEKGK